MVSKSSPRPEQLGLSGPATGFEKFGKRCLMYYRDEDCCTTGLVWEERELVKGEDKKIVRRVKCWHVLYTGPQGQVVHRTLTRDEAAHRATLVVTSVRTAPEAFEEYLRRRLREFGGLREVWALLGEVPPVLEVQSAPASQASHDRMYQRAAELLQTPEADLRKKYGHLNPGLQQMNLRNRLRGKGFNV